MIKLNLLYMIILFLGLSCNNKDKNIAAIEKPSDIGNERIMLTMEKDSFTSVYTIIKESSCVSINYLNKKGNELIEKVDTLESTNKRICSKKGEELWKRMINLSKSLPEDERDRKVDLIYKPNIIYLDYYFGDKVTYKKTDVENLDIDDLYSILNEIR